MRPSSTCPRGRKIAAALLFAAMSCLVVSALPAQSGIRLEDAQADSLFRQGVMRFHDSYHSEAAVLFQKTLSLQPDNQLARIWLGKAYYYAGFESSALQEWNAVRNSGGGSPELTAFMEAYMSRRGLSRDFAEDAQFFPVMTLDRNAAKPHSFRRPGGMVTLPDGTSLFCGFANNAIVHMGPSGKTLGSFSGSPEHLEGPFDMTLLDDKELFITQMLGDSVTRLDLKGNYLGSFGSKGSKDGQFLGPQYITWDGGTYVYISDMGNRRVAKFDRQGNFILNMGMRSPAFAGLERPVGVLWYKDRLFVADASRQNPSLHTFDSSGNHLDTYTNPALGELEGLSIWEKGSILVSSRNGILSFDPSTQTLRTLVGNDNPKSRTVASRMDANGHIISADFDQETMTFFSRLSGVYSGISVQIQRVIADKFPEIVVECNVLDSRGLPVLGLDKKSFSITEGHKQVNGFELLASGSHEDQVEAVIVVQGGLVLDDERKKEAIANALEGITKSLGSRGHFALVSTGSQAGIEAKPGSRAQELAIALEGLPKTRGWYLDQGLRLAVSLLVKSQSLRNIIFIGDGTLQEDSFQQFGLEENLRYMQNNRVRFTMVDIESGSPDVALSYLVRESGGGFYNLYNPEGLLTLGNDLARQKDGVYRFSYRTLFDSDFGRKYLPVEIQAELFQKSGRDDSGYFGPLDLSKSGGGQGGGSAASGSEH